MTNSNDVLIDKILKASEIISNNSRRSASNLMIWGNQITAEAIGQAYSEHRSSLRKNKINRLYEKD